MEEYKLEWSGKEEIMTIKKEGSFQFAILSTGIYQIIDHKNIAILAPVKTDSSMFIVFEKKDDKLIGGQCFTGTISSLIMLLEEIKKGNIETTPVSVLN